MRRWSVRSPVDEEAIERSRHRTDGVLDEAQLLVPAVIAGDDGPADDVAVATEILGRRVDDEIGSEFEGRWLTGVANVLSTATSAPRRRAITASMSTTSSRGLVGLSIQIRRVSSRTACSSAPRSV